MKKNRAVTFVVAGIVLCLNGYSQSGQTPSVIEPYRLDITDSKTTTLIFPFAIQSVDRGSQDVLAGQAKGVQNVLQLKAARKEIEETNLTVITTDGAVHAYLINYAPCPSVLTLRYATINAPAASTPRQRADAIFADTFNQAELQATATGISGKKRTVRSLADKRSGMVLRLEGIYVQKDVFYYQVSLRNRTHLDYTIDQFRFFTRDHKQARRTASQEREITPLFIHHSTTLLKGHSVQVMVIALPKLTLPDQKYLAMEVMEKNGGRHLGLRIQNRTLVRARPIILGKAD